MNILVTINKNYIEYLLVMLFSYCKNNKYDTNVYIMNNDLDSSDFKYLSNKLKKHSINIIDIKVDKEIFDDAPKSKRYPETIYYRLLAYKYLPTNIDRILYLDPDLIVNKDIKELYDINLDNYCFAASTHIYSSFFRRFNELRLDVEDIIYINSGVLLMNLDNIRKLNINENIIYKYINKNRKKLLLPDQDIITKLYHGKILSIDALVYNMTEKLLYKTSIEWVEENSCIIHYCGRNKPWRKHYYGKLDTLYYKYRDEIV